MAAIAGVSVNTASTRNAAARTLAQADVEYAGAAFSSAAKAHTVMV